MRPKQEETVPLRRWAGICLFLGLLGASPLALAGGVRGKVTGFMELVNPVWAEAKRPEAHGYTFREPASTVSAKMRRLFPFIPRELAVAIVATEPQPKMKPIEVTIAGGRASSVTIVTTPGTELRFKNADPFTHRLYGVDQNSFSAAETQAGAERIWAVPSPGLYEVRDEAFPSIRIWVVSDPKVVAYGHPKLDGSFDVEVATPGLHVAKVYFSGKQVGQDLPAPIAGPASVIDLSRTPIVVAKPKAAAGGAK